MTFDFGKRTSVIRSPLELLAEDRTPPAKLREIEKEPTSQQQQQRESDELSHRNRYRSQSELSNTSTTRSTASSPVSRETRGSIRVTRTTSNNVVSVPFGAAPPPGPTRHGSAATLAGSGQRSDPQDQMKATPVREHSRHGDAEEDASSADASTVLPTEPSTLLYLSPSYRGGGGGGGPIAATADASEKSQRDSSAKGKRKIASGGDFAPFGTPLRETASSSSLSSHRSAAVPPNGRHLAVDVTDQPTTMRAGSSPSDAAAIPLSEVDDLIREALEAYESRRDEEEAAILLEIRNETESLQARAAELEQANHTLQHEKDSLSALVERLESQCTALADTTKLIHADLLNERRRCGELEVQVCHADDARRTAVAETARDRDFEHAQFLTMKTEYDSQMDALRKAHSDELARHEFRYHEQDAKLTELTANLASSECEISTLRTKVKESDAALDALRQQLREKESAVQNLARKSSALEKAEGGRRDEVSVLAEKVQKQDETIRQQNDDLRKKLFRIQTLEAEMAKQQQAVAEVHAGAQKLEERSQLVHASAEALAVALREGLRKTAMSTDKRSGKSHQRRAAATDTADEDDVDAEGSSVVEDEDGEVVSVASDFDGVDVRHGYATTTTSTKTAYAPDYTRGNFVVRPSRAALACRGLKHSLPLPQVEARRATQQSAQMTRSHSVPQRNCTRSDASVDVDYGRRFRTSSTASMMGNTLRLLTVARERAHVLLRRLLKREAEEQANVQALKDSLSAEEKRVSESTQKVDGLRQQIDVLSAAHQKAQRRIAALEETCSRQSDELVKRVSELADLRAAAAVDADRVTSLTFAVHEARVDAETKAAALQAAESRAASASAEAARLQLELSAAHQTRESALKVMNDKDKVAHENDALLLQQAREFADVSASREKLQKQVTRLHSELAHTRAEWTRVQEEVSLAHAKLQKSEAALAALRKRHRADDQRSAVIADLERRIDGLARDVADRDAKLSKLKGDADEARAERARILDEERTLRLQLENAVQAREATNAQALQSIRAIESHVMVFSKCFVLPDRSGRGDDDGWGAMHGLPRHAPRSVPPITAPRETHSSESPEVCAALLSLEASLCDVLNRAQLAQAQQRRQVHSLQQTVSFLELEVQCQRSNARSATGGASAARSSRGSAERVVGDTFGIRSSGGGVGLDFMSAVTTTTTGTPPSPDSGVVRVIAATPTRPFAASAAPLVALSSSTAAASTAAAASPPRPLTQPQRHLGRYDGADCLSPQVVDRFPVVAAPVDFSERHRSTSESRGSFVGSAPPTYILVTASPVASADPMPSQPMRSETPPRSGRTPSPPAVRPSSKEFDGGASPQASMRTSVHSFEDRTSRGGERQSSASEPAPRRPSSTGAVAAMAGSKACAMIAEATTASAVVGSFVGAASSCSTSRSVDGLSASPLRPPRMGGRARSLVA